MASRQASFFAVDSTLAITVTTGGRRIKCSFVAFHSIILDVFLAASWDVVFQDRHSELIGDTLSDRWRDQEGFLGDRGDDSLLKTVTCDLRNSPHRGGRPVPAP